MSERLVTPRVRTQLTSAPLPPAKQGQRCGKLHLSQLKTQTNECGVLHTCLQEQLCREDGGEGEGVAGAGGRLGRRQWRSRCRQRIRGGMEAPSRPPEPCNVP